MSRTKIKSPNQLDDAFEDEFHRQLGRLVHAHARFDFNVGLQLNWLGQYYKVEVSDLLDPRKAQLGLRLKKLRKLVLDMFDPAGEAVIADFKAWFKMADESRAIRNDYVHGRWGVPGKYIYKNGDRLMDAEPLLTFVPLHWNMGPECSDDSISMTMEEFASQVDAVERLFGDYFQLTEQYLTFAKPSHLG